MPATQEISQVGKREDLSNIVAIADAKNTPVTSMLRKGEKPKNTLYEWQVDGYDTAKVTGVVDGKDVESYEDASAKRRRLQGRVQLFRRAPKVSKMAEEVSVVAGIPSEFDKAKAKKTIELKRDIETRILGDYESQADDGADDGYEFRGLGNWISNSAQTDLPVHVDYRTPTASIYSSALTDFDEDDLSALLQSRWGQTGTTDELMGFLGADVKRTISNFTRYDVDKSGTGHVRMFNQDAQDALLFNKVDIYDGDFGRVELILSSFVPNAKRGYILDMRMLELRPHTNPYFRELEDRGGGRNGLIEAIVGLACLNPLAHAKIAAS